MGLEARILALAVAGAKKGAGCGGGKRQVVATGLEMAAYGQLGRPAPLNRW